MRAEAYDLAVLARAALLLACLAAIALLAVHAREHHRCQADTAVLFRFGVHRPPPPAGSVSAAARSLRASCEDANALAVGAEGLRYGGRAADGVALAQAATRAEPRTFAVWVAYGDALLAAGRPVAGGFAYERARALNPRWPVPVLPVTVPVAGPGRAGP
jgi:hypothetical protein